ncbi:MAG TPA: hypothetical protein VIB59_03520 [Solirubrobacteraceae bacterium]|jgi:hypothetical protein
MVRRRVAAGAAVVLLIIIVLVINGCLKSQKQQSLKDYNHSVSEISRESDSRVSKPFFTALSGAAGKSAIDVQVQVNQLRVEAQKLASRAGGLSVPGEMTGAQRNLLSALNFRVEGITKIAALLPSALGGQGKAASPKIAGNMEIFLASDVIYSQRVVPLIQESLTSSGIHEATQGSRFLPNLGWLEPNTVEARLTGKASTGGAVAPGTHGSSLVGTAVGTTTLEPEPTLNHVAGGGSPAFTVTVENTGTNAESNVKVDVAITAAGKQLQGSHTINQTQPGSKANVEIPVNGVPLGVASKIQVTVEPVPGEANSENNKATYLAIFGE